MIAASRAVQPEEHHDYAHARALSRPARRGFHGPPERNPPLLPGTLLLVAFLIALPFNSGYTRVSRFDNAVYVALFLCAILSLLLFAAPAAQH